MWCTGIKHDYSILLKTTFFVCQDTYTAKKFDDSMSTAQTYECAVNLFHMMDLYSPSAGVPYNRNGIQNLVDHMWKVPRAFTDILVVAIPDGSFKPHEHKGAWKCVSPEEVRYAFYLAIQRDIDAGVDKAVLEEWLHVALTTTVRFEIINNSMDIFWRNCQLREAVVTAFSAVARTPRQRVLELMNVKDDMERALDGGKVSVQKLAAEYSTKGDLSPANSEKLTDSYVTLAMTVWNAALCVKDIMDVVEKCEAKWNHQSPFNSLYKLEQLVSKSGSKLNTTWAVKSIADACFAGLLDPAGCSIEFFKGKKASGACGYVDISLYKKDVLDHFLRKNLEEQLFSSEISESLRENLRSHVAYRSKVRACPLDVDDAPPAAPIDLGWMRSWPQSACLFLQLVEGLVYGKEFDGALKSAIKSGKSPVELTAYASVKERLTCIAEAKAKEQVVKDADEPVAGPSKGGVPSDIKKPVVGAFGGGDDDDTGSSEQSPKYWRAIASRLVLSSVKLISVENMSMNQVGDRIKAEAIRDGMPGKCSVGVLFEVGVGAESITAPHLRVAPLQKKYLDKVVGGYKLARKDEMTGTIKLGDMYIASDFGKHGDPHTQANRSLPIECSERC
jgi:hypothetical protein